MERDTRYGLDGTTVYTWATTPKDATATAAAFTGIPKTFLQARYTGHLRPGGYEMEYEGNTEIVGDSHRRYAVTGKDSK